MVCTLCTTDITGNQSHCLCPCFKILPCSLYPLKAISIHVFTLLSDTSWLVSAVSPPTGLSICVLYVSLLDVSLFHHSQPAGWCRHCVLSIQLPHWSKDQTTGTRVRHPQCHVLCCMYQECSGYKPVFTYLWYSVCMISVMWDVTTLFFTVGWCTSKLARTQPRYVSYKGHVLDSAFLTCPCQLQWHTRWTAVERAFKQSCWSALPRPRGKDWWAVQSVWRWE